MKLGLILYFLAASWAWCALPEPPPPEILRPGVPEDVYVAPGRATTILLRSGQKVASISLASPVVTYKYDKALNQLEITPSTRTGGTETNLNIRVGPSVYVLLVKVVTDVRAQYLRSFTLEGDGDPDDEAGLSAARPLAPSEIDLVGAVRTLARAESDPIYRKTQTHLKIEPLDQVYSWNDCLVTLQELAQFADTDLIVLRIRWVNSTRDALYLDPGQYGLWIDGVRIPVLARYKEGVGSVIYPGQLETVYLAVQGLRISRRNHWQLGLPPDAAAVGRAFPAGGLP